MSDWSIAEVPRVSRAEEENLLDHYKKCGDEKAEERLITMYVPLVIRIARSIQTRHSPNADVGDYISDGIIGLIYALRKFDPERAIPFSAYCIAYIRSEIRLGICVRTGLTDFRYRVVREMEKARAAIESEYGRAATDAEIGERLGIDRHRYAEVYHFKELMRIHSPGMQDLIDIADLGDCMVGHGPDPAVAAADSDTLRFLTRGLTIEQKHVVTLHCIEGRGIREIAKTFGRSYTYVYKRYLNSVAVMKENLEMWQSSVAATA
ncbi:MAG: sigma-70 family RNA polymerase sigma factor [Planctomycetaceae bacterium]|nr:sigma-70 family RNA polymerase sigma factor [Planctomycetaceae bacterium]